MNLKLYNTWILDTTVPRAFSAVKFSNAPREDLIDISINPSSTVTYVLSSVVPHLVGWGCPHLNRRSHCTSDTLGIPKLVRALHASRLPCHKLAEGWGREEWG